MSILGSAKKGDLEAVKNHIKSGVNIDYKMDLYQAVKQGNTSEVERLIREGVDVDKADKYSRTPLFTALCVELLIEAGADINGRIKMAKWLHSLGVNINADDDYAFGWACENGHIEIAKWLHSLGVNINACNDYAFRWACENGHIEIAKWLHSLGVDINACDDEVFKLTCRRGHIEISKWLYSLGVNINSNGDHAFEWACENGHIETAKWLHSLGVDINANDDFVFRWACEYDQIEIVRWIIEINEKPLIISDHYLPLLFDDEDTELIEYLANVYKEDIDYFVSLLSGDLEVITKTVYKKDGFLMVNGIVINGDEEECWNMYDEDTEDLKTNYRKKPIM